MSRSRVYFVFSLSSLCFLGCSRETLKDESCACTSNCKIADRYIQNGTCRKENVALGNEATMSEPYNEEAYGGRSGPACLANNGNMNRTYLGESQRQSGGPQCIHTQTKNGGGWWQVDLGRNYLISSIAVYGRVDFLDRMPTSITVNGQTCYTGMPNEKDLIIDLNQTTVGQTVNVSTNASVEFLNICQVQVWVDQCSCIRDNTTSCSPEGHCRMDNVALGKVAYMSSVYVEQTKQAASQACLAVDGNPGQRHNTITSSNCIMSSPADVYSWWEVDLGQDYTINKITVYTLESYVDNMKGVEISVDGQTCYTFSNTTQPSTTNDVNCSQARKGKFVTFTSRDNKQLVLCEVQIWVCSWGFYGESCKNNCGKCNNATCDVENGTCPTSCELGFTGPLCQETCGHCLNNSTCNPVSGTCDEGCIQGFEGHSCKECAQGYYDNGSVCTLCGHCINGSACNNITGICVDCEYGWQQPQCNVCSWGLYGENCTETCGKCQNNASCDVVNGTCPNGCENGFADPLCEECDMGFYGKNCKQVCGKCLNNAICEVLNGTCSTGCKLGFGGPLCNVCSWGLYGENCIETCGKCHNNASCDVVNGTCPTGCENGFADPFCKECAQGYYGNESTCIPCGNCFNGSACNYITGNCDDCENGWQQPLCTLCDDKHYDSKCSSECGHCFNNGCNKLNGVCNYGCEAGWWNSTCKDECPVGFYGRNCEKACGRCLNRPTCDPVNGSCAGSCVPGFTGTFCSDIATSGESGNTVGPIVGAIVGGFIILSISLSVTIIYLRRYKSRSADNINTTSNVLQPATDTQASIQPSKQDESTTEYDEIGNPYDSLHPADDSENHNYASHATEERKSKSKEDKPSYVNVITKNNF